ncbi:FCD domain-containing protein [Polycladidibacter hongkongensis]|uniref:FCD domain-containing protein n=1 Tax=Polycladidibacter hongkongensis TaxID=1647556 RepID=UPI000835F00B|nr:FCD domain-containing protein [Pseudovibrio hongkongensis]
MAHTIEKHSSFTIAETLIAEIVSGVFSQTTNLPSERELCERFNVSRTIIREAILRIQLAGYLEIQPGRRAQVTTPKVAQIIETAAQQIQRVLGKTESISQMEQIRQHLECGSVREAVHKASNQQIALMRDALEHNYHAIGTPQFLATDNAFHKSIAIVSGNEMILALYGDYLDTMLAQRPTWQDPEAHDRLVYKEHLAIYECILGGDADKAAALMRRHLERSYRSRLLSVEPLAID